MTIFHRSHRWTRRALLTMAALLLTAVTATRAYACLDICLERYGEFYVWDYDEYQLTSCSQRWNATGGTTTVCNFTLVKDN